MSVNDMLVSEHSRAGIALNQADSKRMVASAQASKSTVLMVLAGELVAMALVIDSIYES